MTPDPSALEALRYPMGRFSPVKDPGPDVIAASIAAIGDFPSRLGAVVSGLSARDLELLYRPGGWTVRQVVHHLADSHINAHARFRWTLTEEAPKLRSYDGPSWSELADGRSAPPEWSAELLVGLHRRWTWLLESLDPAAWGRPATSADGYPVDLGWLLQLYAWHGPHHLAHIELALRTRTESEPLPVPPPPR